MTPLHALNESQSGRIQAIDGLRALAILMVYTFHVWEFSGMPHAYVSLLGAHLDLAVFYSRMHSGVDLFLVLSGFCLFFPLCHSTRNLAGWKPRSYFLRRVRRIAPPYYAAIGYSMLLPSLLVIAFRAIGRDANWQSLPSAWQVISHLLFIHTLFPETWNGINGSFWSLGLEAQFYIAFPLAVLGFRRFGFRVIPVMILCSVLYRGAAAVITADAPWTVQFLASIFFLGRWMQFALGMAAAWTVANLSHRGHGPLWAIMLLILSIGTYVLAASPLAEFRLFPLRDILLATAFAGIVVSLCAAQSPFRRLAESGPVAGLGFISYSVFLIHQPTIYYLSEFLIKNMGIKPGTTLMMTLWTCGLVPVGMVAYLFFRAFESPFLSPGKRSAVPLVPVLSERAALARVTIS